MIKGKRYTYVGEAWTHRSAQEIANIAEGRTQTYAGFDKYHPQPGGYTETKVLTSGKKYTVWGRFQCKCGVLLNRKNPEVIRGWRLCPRCIHSRVEKTKEIDWDRKARTRKRQRSKSKVGRT